MEFNELICGLNEVINNNDNNLKHSYELLIRPVIDYIVKDGILLHEVTNRNVDEIKKLDIKTFYTEVNLCKKIKRLNQTNYENN